MGPSCSSPRTASSMVSPRRAMRPIVAIYPRVANHRPVGTSLRRPRQASQRPLIHRLPDVVERTRASSWGAVGDPRTLTRISTPTTEPPSVSGKRRANGPAVKKSAAKRPPRTRKQKVLRVVKWLAIVGLVGLLVATAGFVVLYRAIDIPDP